MAPCKLSGVWGVVRIRLTPAPENRAGFADVTTMTSASEPKSGSVRGRPGRYGSVTSRPFRLYSFSVHERPREPKSSRRPVSRPPVSSLLVTVEVSWFSSSDHILRVVGSLCMETCPNRVPTKTSRSSNWTGRFCLLRVARAGRSTMLTSRVRAASIVN